ncbi:MAG: hypothetical protein KAX20_06930, partial [Candidatus Omnitrophica bacterium]|nr:hypothetical protein [Candidatus Omnitrophota bacterium]
MTNLNEILAPIVEKIKKFRSLYEQNEMAVRDQIVNPILRALGWNPENPEEVQPNISIEEGVPDYSLIKNGKRVLFMEAKNLRSNVEQEIRQLAKYCFGEGTKYGVLTNGVVWILFRSFIEEIPLAERVVWKVDIENEELQSVLRKLQTISKDNVEQVEMLVKKVQILDEVWTSLSDEPEEMIRGLMPTVKIHIGESYPNYQFNDAEIEDFLKERIREMTSGVTEAPISSEPEIRDSWQKEEKPKRMKLSGEVFEIQSANEILTNTADWLIKKGKLKISDCPVPAGPKRYL